MRFFLRLKNHRIAVLTFTCAIGLTGFKAWGNRSTIKFSSNSPQYLYWKKESAKIIPIESIPNRPQQIKELRRHCRSSSLNYKYYNDNGNHGVDEIKEEYDILVIGGGATGSGICLDAVTRGLSVALIDASDFASGTSSRSTKLIHGGVRYLENAIKTLNKSSWNLVREAVLERYHLINLTPHLSYAMPIILPIYDSNLIRGWSKLIYNYIGLKLYESLAGKDGLLCPTHYLSSPHSLNIFPHLKSPNMIGSIVYYDGIHNDSRMCLYIMLTAAYYGATCANYCECVDFIKEYNDSDDNEKIIGVRLRDNLTGSEWNTYAKTIVNATGFYSDKLRKLDNNNSVNLITASSGTHVILPGTFSSKNYGVLIPNKEDDRVSFLLPFEGVTIAGTTDNIYNSDDISLNNLIKPREEDVNIIISEINNYLDIPVNLSDIDAVWSGIRPLAKIPNNGYTQQVINGTFNFIEPIPGYDGGIDEEEVEEQTSTISRHHLIELSSSGLITICGGKWTTYRQMAEDCLNIICDRNPDLGRRATECVTKIVKLIGAANWTHSIPAILSRHQIPAEISEHLSRSYGDKSFIVGNLYLSSYNKLLAGGYPYTEAEVIYCSEYEMAYTAVDILSRRTRLAQLNKAAAEYALPRVIKLMGDVHKWNVRERVMQYHDTMQFLRTMHVKDRHKWGRSRHTLNYSRRVVEEILSGPSMTDEAIQFVIDRFWDYHSQNINEYDEDDDDDNITDDDHHDTKRNELKNTLKKHVASRKLFEGCISRYQVLLLAKEFSQVFGDDRVIDALMFTGQEQLGLYEILVSCAACAANPSLFEWNYWY